MSRAERFPYTQPVRMPPFPTLRRAKRSCPGGVLPVIALALALAGAPAAAISLPEGAVQTANFVSAPGSYALPTSVWTGSGLSRLTAEGSVTRSAWRIPDTEATTLAILQPMRATLVAEGFRILLDCEAATCGGFDFRYALDILPEPEMHVDLGDFRYVSAEKVNGGGARHVALIVSKSGNTAHVQVVEVAPFDPSAPQPAVPATDEQPETGPPVPPPATGTFAQRIEAEGTVPLTDLVFKTGSSELGPGRFSSLAELAGYLSARPDLKVTLVGHTDAEGSLDANVALSKRRAQSVADRLIAEYGVSASQVSAEGAGFLAPRASNLTPAGRTENRGVEAMLTSTR